MEESATLVAITVAVLAAVIAGASNKPVLETVPAVADQVVPVLLVPLTVALNCTLPLEATVVLAGDICTLMTELPAAGITLMVSISTPTAV